MQALSSDNQKLLVFIDWFWPGYKAGGPIRAAVNFVTHMQHDYDMYVFTTDRDLNSSVAYAEVVSNKWVTYGQRCLVYYCSPAKLNWKKIQAVIDEIQPRFIYLNSLFSKYFAIYPLLLQRRNRSRVKLILAPRGMLKASALQFKSGKKKLYLALFKKMQLHKDIVFQATDYTEYDDVKLHFGSNVNVAMAPDFPDHVNEYPGSTEKVPGELNIIFVGRLHPIKQLDFLLHLLPGLAGSFLLTVVGMEEDRLYIERCKKIISAFSSNIRVVFKGGVPNHQLPGIFVEHHIFALPTKGENFGHAIFEALAQGKPVLISDQTPWRNLSDRKAGWDLSLNQPTLFQKVLKQAAEMDQAQYNEWSESAWRFARDFGNQSELKTAYKKIFS